MGRASRPGQTGSVTSLEVPRPRPLRRMFGPLAARDFWAEYAWLGLSGPLTLFSLFSFLVLLALGLVLTPVLFGFLVLAGTLSYARGIGAAHRGLAKALLGVSVPAPRRAELKPGLWAWVRARVGDPAGWRAAGYLLLRVPLTLAGMATTISATVYAVAATPFAFLWWPLGVDHLDVFDIQAANWVGSLAWSASGLLVLVALPWVTHAFVTLDRMLVVGLLGARELSERVRDLEASRATAVEDSALRLRRIERDLHDGAQAQLVALAMKLGLAKDELEDVDLPQVKQLVTAAHTNAKQALTELRDLARGIHPAALDAGLDVALATLVATSGMDARVAVDLPRRPPPSLETIVYFSAAELLTNAAKHSGTTTYVEVTEERDVLWLRVRDRGRGGARLVPGGGLAGVAERLRTVDGELTVASPVGGPTEVTARVPLPR
ncbi:Two-component system sensor histidine kinase [Amycolatopsis camponoti]|uniref:histidine kinase n=1 Tax=Amycolatopsis camponoti TaxID=2606593 RepID=A0A6I8LT75_9PSEU|nr:sensor domain-containing protein [Amycolatopsis camponoti]VVJ20292.1 Two-component system sensor histidine kinase [Amycolatopsis camponoti]